jgi:hypothetical protein
MARNDDKLHLPDLAARCARVLLSRPTLFIQRAQGMPGARCARSLACRKNTRVSHHGHAGSPGIPRAMVLTAYFALSPVTGLVCHRRLADTSATLDASVGASGPHDFAVRVQCHSSFDMPRPLHPVPYVRDDRETPLCVGRDGERHAGDLRQTGTEIFLQKGLDTHPPSAGSVICPSAPLAATATP